MGVFSAAYPCVEMHNTRVEVGTREAFTASVQLQCAYAQRLLLADELLTSYTSWPSFPLAKAKTVSIASDPGVYAASGQECVYDFAILTVGFSTLDVDVVSESLEPTAEFQTLDHRLFRWGSETGDALSEAEAPGKLIRGMSLQRTYYNLAAVNPLVLTLPGSSNNADYTSTLLGLTFPEETLMFGLPQISRKISTGAVPKFTLSLKFSYKASGWNKFFRSTTNDYEYMYLAEGSASPYKPHPPANFAAFLS